MTRSHGIIDDSTSERNVAAMDAVVPHVALEMDWGIFIFFLSIHLFDIFAILSIFSTPLSNHNRHALPGFLRLLQVVMP